MLKSSKGSFSEAYFFQYYLLIFQKSGVFYASTDGTGKKRKKRMGVVSIIRNCFATGFLFINSMFWIYPPTQDAIVTPRILVFLVRDPNLNLHLPRLNPGWGDRSKYVRLRDGFQKSVEHTCFLGDFFSPSTIAMLCFQTFLEFSRVLREMNPN